MKRTLLSAFTFVATVGMSVFGTSLTPAQQAGPTKTQGLSEKAGVSAYFDSLPLAAAKVKQLKFDSKGSSDKAALQDDREKVEVLARNITFPEVLNQGQLMLSTAFHNATILCLDAALYAGRVEGLILAMDRDTVMDHRLFWTIDAAGDLFNTCLKTFLVEAFAGQDENDENQLKNVQRELNDQIEMIQHALRYAQSVKIKGSAQNGVSCDRQEVFFLSRRVNGSGG